MSNHRRRKQKRAELRKLLLGGVIAVSGAATASAQNPTGGTVVAGAATISNAGSTLNVNASTDRAVINWQSFSIGQGNTANFNLPSASSAVLNRVTTPNTPSAIHGALNSNGNVFLVNPSGVLVGPSGVVNTNAFTASTFDIGNQDFMNGGPMTFRGSSTAEIVNQGTINTGSGGAHFIANQFTNSGTINSLGGSVTVGSGRSVTYSNGVTHVEADMATLQNGYSETASMINNSGAIRATGAVMSGGEVYLTNPGGKVLNSGVIQASHVAVSAGQFNQVGTVDVSGQTGGGVVVNSNDTLVQGTINASGIDQGGSVEINSGTVDQYAAIDVSASDGSGGEVSITTSNGYTATTAGAIVADGESGGDVTITGPGRIVTSATISATGMDGDGGNIDVASDFKTSLLGATLDASGSASGGQIRVGGEFQGGKDLAIDELANSSETLVSPGSKLISRGETGEGGTAIVWSDDRTQFYGGVDVTGNAAGGFVELSSAGSLVYQTTDEILTGGGTVLLDPKNGIVVDVLPSGLSVVEFALADESEPLDPFDSGGFAVALSADGTILASGAPFDDGGDVAKINSGAVYLFSIDPGSLVTPSQLTQILRDGTTLADGSTLLLEADDQFGRSVALNSAGSVLAVGAPNDDPIGFDQISGDLSLDDTGAVYLFDLNAANSAAPADLRNVIRNDSPLAGGGVLDLLATEDPSLANPRLGGDRFGEAVALNGVGNRLAVGTGDNSFPRVYLFEVDANNLSNAPDLGQILQSGTNAGGFVLAPDGLDEFGVDLALNATGDLLAVGANRESNDSGAVYLFDLNENDYATRARFLQRISDGSALSTGGTLPTANSNFGSALSFANDGQILAVGASSATFQSGGVFVLGLDPNDSSLMPALVFANTIDSFVLSDGTNLSLEFSGLGDSIALSESGNLIVFGLPQFDGLNDLADSSGGGLLFAIDQNGQPGLGQIVSDRRPLAAIPSLDSFGTAVALNGAATKLAVSASPGIRGEVYLFDLDPTDLGEAPSLAGVIKNGTRIETPTGSEFLQLDFGDDFGSALSFNSVGDRLAVGATGDDYVSTSNTDKGAVYLFELVTSGSESILSLPQVLREQTTLADGSMLTLSNSSEFGTAIALDGAGNRLAAGQALNDRVLLFEFGLNGFDGPASLAQTLEDGSILAGGGMLAASASGDFGTSVAITRDGTSLAVGAQGFGRSSVFLFDLDENNWAVPATLAQTLLDGAAIQGGTLDLGTSDRFGTSVAFDSMGNRLVIGQRGATDSLFLFETQPDLSQPLDLITTIGTGTMLSDGTTLGVGSNFASTLSLSGDGNVLAVGTQFGSQAYLFEFESGDYSDPSTLQQSLGSGSLIGQFNGLPALSEFGTAVALDGDGSRLAISADSRVFLFDADTSLATDPVLSRIIGDGIQIQGGQLLDAPGTQFGEALALNSSGELLAIGDPSNRGQVLLLSLDAANSAIAPKLGKIIRDGFEFGIVNNVDLDVLDGFGTSVSFNRTGSRLAVGADSDDGLGNSAAFSGGVYLFELNPNDLSQSATLGQIIQNGSSLAGVGTLQLNSFERFGRSVTLNALGDRLAVGSRLDSKGAVYLFELDSNDSMMVPTLAQLLQDQSILADGSTLSLQGGGVASFFDSSDNFGSSVAFDGAGTQLFVGADGDNGVGDIQSDSGAVYQFDLDANDLSQTPSLNQLFSDGGSGNPGSAIDVEAGDRFGRALAVNSVGDFLAIGAPGADATNGNVRDSVGSVFLISLGGGGSSAFPLTGDLAFGDFPADTTIIDPDDIAAILNAGNDLTLQFSNDLEIRSDITTAMTGVGKLTVQTGRSINVLPGTDIRLGDGSLDLQFNSADALASQTDSGSPTLRLNDVSITATGEDSLVKLSADEFGDFLTSDEDPLIHITGSTIVAPEIQIGDRRAFIDDQRILIDGGTVISGSEVFLRASNNTSGIGIEITGPGTELNATQGLLFGTLGGIRISDGALLQGLEDGEITFAGIQFPNDPTFDGLIQSGDSVFVEDASIRTENGLIAFELANAGALSGNVLGTDGPPVQRNTLSLIDSEIVAGGMGSVALGQVGDDAYQVNLSGSTISGQNVLIAMNGFAFSTQAGVSTVNLKDQSQINTAPDGELRIFLPQQAGVMVDATSSFNGIAGSDLLDGNGNLINSLGIGEFIGENPPLPLEGDYLGTADANVAFYLASIDLTPGLFFTANDGSSTYGQTPVDPGLSITQGVLQEGDTLQSIGVGTDFNLTQFSDVGMYTINVESSDLDPTYRLLGTSSGTFTILPADLVVTGGTYTKTYGDTFVFPDNDFTVQGLVNGEMIGPVQWLSLGTRPDADVMDTPYAVGLNVSGQGSFNPLNYNISFTNGGLTVNPADLFVNPLTQQKVYGDSMLDRTRFEAIGLKNGETIQQVSFSSPGITATANVGLYDLAASGIAATGNGFDANNYNIELGSLSGGLMVTPAPLLISADDQLKLIGTEFVFNGTEFTVTGLKNSDTVSQVELASGGVTEDAELGQYVINATNPSGNLDLGNYNLTINNGVLTVRDEISLPEAVIRTDNLVYDQFGRYIDFANTVNVLTPTKVGTINVRPTSTSESEKEPGGDEVREEDGIVYLPEMRFSSRD